MSNLSDTIEIIAEVLQLGERATRFDADTPLLGSVPEFDSMAVVSVITAIEDNYGFIVEDDEVSAELFETVGSLHEFIVQKSAD
ncbi:acyl carrier protein [Sedimenticola selenatireducens]|uniref:Acyl carrier protein n=1 Tax=Sedimenticola selenatireducens TaxID=191960 RepID=A0A557S869_9GAMM|nr:phosphopantetheine-binding protein [Sedimenticola selenatireducens]TVO73587.1 acyl carrier protein [Sedimenticola selenatireducens]TVT63527.1 MAG: acyl carrier protein [Sedimenticola selenatireducens]